MSSFATDRVDDGTDRESTEIKRLREKVHKKDEVISWLTEENIGLKKSVGDL